MNRACQAPAPRSAPPIVFLHIPKCAGTSVVSMFSNLFGETRSRRLHLTTPEATARDIAGALDPAAGGAAFISGHVPFSFLASHLPHFRLFTMLRDPVSRVASLFRFLRRHPRPAEIGLPKAFTFDDLMASPAGEIFPIVDNAMCRMLSRAPMFHDAASPSPWTLATHADQLEEALATLRDHEFGLAERMPESSALLQHHFGVPFALDPGALNASSPGDEAMTPQAAAQCLARNELDFVLYERAQKIFTDRLNAPRPRPARGDAAGMVFRPALDVPAAIWDVPGRQGFHDFFEGTSWIVANQTARLHFLAPARSCRLVMVLYGLSRDYPIERIALRLNGKPAGFWVIRRAEHWVQVQTETLRLGQGIQELSITPPIMLKVRDHLPDGEDGRHLSVGISSFLFSNRFWPPPPEHPYPWPHEPGLPDWLRHGPKRLLPARMSAWPLASKPPA